MTSIAVHTFTHVATQGHTVLPAASEASAVELTPAQQLSEQHHRDSSVVALSSLISLALLMGVIYLLVCGGDKPPKR